MKKVSKLLVLVLAFAMMAFAMVGCGNDKKPGEEATWKDDLANAKKVVIGYTINAPMGIEDNGTVTGFDIDLAREVFKDSGVTVETKLIQWGSKEMELNSKTIDLVWNGLTVNDERKQNMQLSDNYLINQQAVVVKKDAAASFTSVDSLAGKKVAVEDGSAGLDAINAINKESGCVVESQIKALMEVKAGTSDAAIIDATMAGYLLNSDTSFGDLQMVNINYDFTKEYYAVAAKKGNTKLIEFVNAGIKKAQENGKYDELLTKYGLTDRAVNK